jgi:hypothetical protein
VGEVQEVLEEGVGEEVHLLMKHSKLMVLILLMRPAKNRNKVLSLTPFKICIPKELSLCHFTHAKSEIG